MNKNEIIKGNALEELKKLPDESVDMVVTSPPYNKHSANRNISKQDSWKQADIGYGDFDDNLPEGEYQQQQKEVMEECLRILKKKGSIFYNHKPRIKNHEIIHPIEWLNEFIIRQIIIWNRKSTPVIEPIRFYPTTEYIFWLTKEKATPKFDRNDLLFEKEVWDLSPDTDKEHPATFPKKLPLNCIKATTDEGDLVLDPYMGIGKTAQAAKELNRDYLGIELNPDYIEIAEERLAQQKLI